MPSNFVRRKVCSPQIATVFSKQTACMRNSRGQHCSVNIRGFVHPRIEKRAALRTITIRTLEESIGEFFSVVLCAISVPPVVSVFLSNSTTETQRITEFAQR